MLSIRISHLLYTFSIGIFAGLLYTFEKGVIPSLDLLNGQGYAVLEQALIKNIDATLSGFIFLAVLGMLLPLYPLIRLWRYRYTSFWKLTFIAWILFCFGVSVFTMILNVPINNYVKTWNSANPPADWQTARDNWNELNTIRTPINILSFALLIWAGFKIKEIEPV